MYKQKNEVIEDMVVTQNCPGGRKIFTGGESVLNFPFTISFMCEGNYKVSIRNGEVRVEREDK